MLEPHPPAPAQPSQQHQSSGKTEASPEAESGRRGTLLLDTFSMVQSVHFSGTRQYVSPFPSSLCCHVNQDQDRCPSPRQCPFQDLLVPILPWCPPVTALNREAHPCSQTFCQVPPSQRGCSSRPVGTEHSGHLGPARWAAGLEQSKTVHLAECRMR